MTRLPTEHEQKLIREVIDPKHRCGTRKYDEQVGATPAGPSWSASSIR